MALFEKGKSGNPAGKKAGTKNKAGAKVKEIIEGILTEPANAERLKTEFASLKGRDFVKAYTELAPYVIPKMNHNSVDLERLTDEQVDELYDKIINSLQ